MVRSAVDATRFTSTGPYASSKPTLPSQFSLPIGSKPPANETPAQKIARLRAAAAQARLAQENKFDKVVRIGRVWADRAHRITAWSLIGLSVVSGVFATFAIGDMLLHNRRKRNEWLQDQQHKTAVEVEEARKAVAQGSVTEAQMLLLNRERAAQEAEAARKARKGIFTRAKEAVYSSVSNEEKRGGQIMSEVQTPQEILPIQPQTKLTANIPVDINTDDFSSVSQLLNPSQGTIQSRQITGGVLDRQAQATLNGLKSKTATWTRWITG